MVSTKLANIGQLVTYDSMSKAMILKEDVEIVLDGEKIIDMNRDLNHICGLGSPCQEQKKPAIWVAGTCSFGKYDNPEQIMSEKLLFNNYKSVI